MTSLGEGYLLYKKEDVFMRGFAIRVEYSLTLRGALQRIFIVANPIHAKDRIYRTKV